MDPNAALAEIRKLTRDVLKGRADEEDIERLAELIEGLDNWLSKGGFLPKNWDR